MSENQSGMPLRATLTQSGALLGLANGATGDDHGIAEDAFEVTTDRGQFDSRGAQPVRCASKTAGPAVMFDAQFCDIALEYVTSADRPWLKRRLTLTNIRQRLAVERIAFKTVFRTAPAEFVNYDTFWNAPTVAFLRFAEGGVFTGIENPFFRASFREGVLELAFEPGLILEPGEVYETEPQFIGVYRRSGVMMSDHPPRNLTGRRPRFRNPCGHIPLDRSEIRAMQRFAADYLAVDTRRFHFILYNFFYPLPQMPAPGSPEEAIHLKMVDTFADLGGDLIIFNPMFPYTKPEGRMDAYWDLGPEGSAARKIMDRAAAKGIGFGYYMGCARHGGEGNACALPFAPGNNEWKKVDDRGATAAENCMACDGFAAWWLAVQRNTIERYRLKLWSWDPGPGNGLFCHSDRHGHLPGKGGYRGWRNATAVMKKLKEEFPGIYFQAFYGRKEHGLWGFKHFDQHESYWEVSLAFHSSMHSELSADRMNADGIRQQAWWNQMFRFHPPQLSHSMTHRQQEGVWDPRLARTWDHLGWKFSFMSSLAACGSILVTILPEDLTTVPGLREFYAKWLKWAREHYDYVPFNVPFGAQVRPGGVDGWARVKGAHGFVFLCNPGPRPARTAFTLDDEIGLEASGRFTLKELYPTDGRLRADACDGRRVFATGERVALVVPAHEVVLLELAEAAGTAAEETVPAGSAIPAREKDGALLPRALDDWHRPDGSLFTFPRHPAAQELTLATAFRADPKIRDLLASARPRNLKDFESLIPQWKKDYPDNFAWARPDRLWLVLPLTDADQVGAIALHVNGAAWPVECHTIQRKLIHYADITDAVRWGGENSLRLVLLDIGADQFLGPYLDYPPADPVAEALAAETAPVIYDCPLDSEPSPRVRTSSADTRRMPVVTEVAMTPPFLKVGQETVFTAAVDMPPGELEGVYLAGPWHDVAMQYDALSGRWALPVGMGDRSGLIMDVHSYFVWAVAKNGLVGATKEIPLAWRF